MLEFEVVETDERFTKSRCCCEFFCIRKGTLISGIYQLIFISLNIVLTILLARLTNEYNVQEYVHIRFNGILLATIAILLIGISKNNYRYLIPFLVFQVCSLF